MSNDIEAHRDGYMELARELVEAAVDRREGVLNDMQPPRLHDTDEKEILKRLAKANQKIAALCDRMRLMERQAGNCIGVPALLGGDVPNPIRIALTILATRVTSYGVVSETRSVAFLADVCAGNVPKDSLLVYEAFRKGGTLMAAALGKCTSRHSESVPPLRHDPCRRNNAFGRKGVCSGWNRHM